MSSTNKISATSVFPVLVLVILIFTIFTGTGERLHAQMLNWGIGLWDDYTVIRDDIPAPDCNPNFDMESAIQELKIDFERNDEFGLLTFDRQAAQHSLQLQQDRCVQQLAQAEAYRAKATESVKLYGLVEMSIGQLTLFSIRQEKLIFLVLLFTAAAYTTLLRHHICFRNIKTQVDYWVATSAQLVGHSAFAVSAWFYKESLYGSGVEVLNPELVYLLFIGFLTLSGISVYQLLNRPKDLLPGGNLLQALLCIPLYTMFSLAAVNYFFVNEGHVAGIAIFFAKSFNIASIFITMALYIWCGMLLRQTQLAERVFDVFKPWGLPPELLAVVAVVLMGFPTAYSGASGIILLAAGAVIFHELRRVGARRQLALATTAMSGGAGVVLSPCILIVMIAILNKEVVTDELFYWGQRVFCLTILVFVAYALITKREPLSVASPKDALSPSLSAFKQLLPYGLILLAICIGYALILDGYLDQFSAPVMLPVVLIAYVIYEKHMARKKAVPITKVSPGKETNDGVGHTLTASLNDGALHIGALLTFGCASLPLAGVVERSSSSMIAIPETFSSVWIAMTFFVVAMVLIGMFIDAIGAIALISGSFALIAYNSGIHPIHFWMVALVAVELGYLSPPVAMNHLLVRQVVGEKEVELSKTEGHNFWYRHERILLPIAVMGTTLLIVAYGPLLLGYR